jgi:hypothetical protein
MHPENTVIILDWDDTLFPTTWVHENNIQLTNKSNREKYMLFFRELDNILYKLLTLLQKYGLVIIVTNAMPVWVKVSCSVLPNTERLLEGIKVVSARKMYHKTNVNMIEWKKMAFKNEITNLLMDSEHMHIITIGDAEYEFHAMINISNWKTHHKKILKFIKLVDSPHHDKLIEQLEMLIKSFDSIAKHPKHMHLTFKHKSN